MTIRQISILGAVLLVVACSVDNSKQQLPTPVATLSVITAKMPDSNPPAKVPDTVKATREVDIDSLEAAAIRPVGDIVSRVGTELQIRLLSGRIAIRKDNYTGGMAYAVPRYAGYLKAIHSHVIHQYQYEGEGIYWVVDDSTGDSTIVWGMPVVSPDGNRFAFTSMEGMEGGNPGRIEIWRIAGRKPEKEFSLDTENIGWAASDAVWRDSVTIDFFKNTYSDPSDKPVHTIGRLARAGTTWLLSSPH
jgi:hypothetical protein